VDPYDFQSLDCGYLADVMRAHGFAYCGWERGLGKSLAACLLLDDLEAQSTLVVSPNTAKQPVWGAELARFLPTHEVVVLRNTKAQREKDLGWVKALRKAGKAVVLVVHYEALDIIHDAKRSPTTWRQLGEWDLIVADEAHRLSNPKAKMTKALKKFQVAASWRSRAASSRTTPRSCSASCSGATPSVTARSGATGTTATSTTWRTATPASASVSSLSASRRCARSWAFLWCYRRKEDELDLPSKTEQTLYVELAPRQRKAYDDLLRDCITQLDDGTVSRRAKGWSCSLVYGNSPQVSTLWQPASPTHLSRT
jgi:hypothetical protein